MFTEAVAAVCLGWYVFIVLVCTIGYIQLFRYYRHIPDRASVLSKPENVIPHVTVIRPCKGHEPYLYECLAATFQQDYPKSKLTVYFCISSRNDPAFPTLQQVLNDHKEEEARIFVEEDLEDDARQETLGPNPKIRNMSRAYSEAKGDLIWIIDCNVWVSHGACGRMVDKLCGYGRGDTRKRPYKLVHHLPISIDVEQLSPSQRKRAFSYDDASTTPLAQLPPSSKDDGSISKLHEKGGRLDELFLSSSHAKMYVAINTVAVAPCIVGKSNMFRASQLNSLTDGKGIDYFSYNICEDHLIGDLLWRSQIPNRDNPKLKYKNHGLVLGDLAIQPVSGMSVANYIARRVRWLRVRKFTVPVATLVEPGTESILCSFYGAFGVTTLSYTQDWFGDKWSTMLLLWLLSLTIWALVDWTVYLLLHSGRTVETADRQGGNTKVPRFVKPLTRSLSRRPWGEWMSAWVGREILALPIWIWAIWGGVTVTWRDRKFWVGMDMKVHAIDSDESPAKLKGRAAATQTSNGFISSKKRVD